MLSLTVSVVFTPLTGSGLLFFTSTSEIDFDDFFSLALVDGYVELRYSLGSVEVVLIRSANRIQLNMWHVVTAVLNSRYGELVVDNELPVTGSSPPPFTVLNTQNNVWLGGYASFINLSSIANSTTGFNGAIFSLAIDDRNLGLIVDADFGYGVSQYSTDVCENSPCMNGATCMEQGPSFVCQCPSGFTGALCVSMVDRCVSEKGLCAENATCQSREDGIGYICLCPLGMAGERCDES